MVAFNPNSLFSANFQTGNQAQDFMAQQQLDAASDARKRFMMNPIYGGYTEDQYAKALASVGIGTGGNGLLGSSGTLGGVPIDSLGFPSMNSITNVWGNDPMIQDFDSKAGGLLSLGYALSGPNGMPAQLHKKANNAMIQQQLAQQMAYMQQAQQQQAQQQQAQEQQAMMMMMMMMMMMGKAGQTGKTGATKTNQTNPDMMQFMNMMKAMMGG